MAPLSRSGFRLVLLAGIGVAVYAFFCSLAGFMPRCPLRMFSGLQCPGCGSQRAFHALLGGHFVEAWSYNLILPPVLIYMLLLVVLPSVHSDKARWLHAALSSVTAMVVLLFVLVAWWIIRNIFDL